ncbi:MAG TPA: hypothetical protein VNO82_18265 [Solirubrobacteraceae bacterium]|nr:hypothetical protein [Solirubrobacteraceae bacterium]
MAHAATAALALATFAPAVAGAQQANGGRIAIPELGTARPFPSTIVVSNPVGTVENVTVTLRGVDHGCPIDLDIQLTSPSGTRVILASDAGAPPGGGCPDADDVELTFDDAAATPLPDVAMRSGSYRPANYAEDDPLFCGPEEGLPNLTGGTALAAFAGEDPRGAWSLSVVDDCVADDGSIAGWSLDITTTGVPVPDTTAPRVDMLGISPRCIRDPARAAAVSVRYLLSEDATVTYEIARRVDSGRWRRCPRPAAGGRPGTYERVRSLTEPTPAGTVRRGPLARTARTTRTVSAGRRAVALADLVQDARLGRGTYLVTMLARDASGNRSIVARTKFWVLSGSSPEARIGRAGPAGRAKNDDRSRH